MTWKLPRTSLPCESTRRFGLSTAPSLLPRSNPIHDSDLQEFFTGFPSRFTATPIDAQHPSAHNRLTIRGAGCRLAGEQIHTCRRARKMLFIAKEKRRPRKTFFTHHAD